MAKGSLSESPLTQLLGVDWRLRDMRPVEDLQLRTTGAQVQGWNLPHPETSAHPLLKPPSVQQPGVALLVACEQTRSELLALRDPKGQGLTTAHPCPRSHRWGEGRGRGSLEVGLEEAARPGSAGGGDSSQLQIESANGFSLMRKARLIMTNRWEQQAKRVTRAPLAARRGQPRPPASGLGAPNSILPEWA